MSPDELFEGIRLGSEHVGGIRCLRLIELAPAYFAEISGEVDHLCRECPASDVTHTAHITHWTRPFGSVLQYSLLNRTGRFDDFSTDHDLSCLNKRFHHAAAYPAIARFINRLPHLVNFRVNVLGPHSGLSPHEESAMIRTRSGAVGARIRLHLPVFTNPSAELVLDNHVYHLRAGVVYFVNHGCVHAATNRGDQPRVHCAWDMLLTRDVFQVLFGDGPVAPDLMRVDAHRCTPDPLRVERMGACRRLPPTVPLDELSQARLCDPQ